MRYAVPLVCVAAALAARMALAPLLGSHVPHATFCIAVAASAAYGGLGPGLLAMVLGGLMATYFFIPPFHHFLVHGIEHQSGLGLYLVVSGLLLSLAETQRRMRLHLEAEVAFRRRAETDERLQRQWLEVTLSSIGDGVIAADAAGCISFINEVACSLTGWQRHDALGQRMETVFAIRNEDTGEAVESPVTRVLREGSVVGLANHTELVARDGRRIPIEDSGAPIRGKSGEVLGAVLVFRDASAARTRDSALRERDRLIECSHDAIIIAGPDRRIRHWNVGACETYGWSEEEALGHAIHALLQTRNPETIAVIDRILSERGRWDGELIHTCKDGRAIVMESRHVLLRGPAGEPAGILEINRDITGRKYADDELKRTAAIAEEGRRTLEVLMEQIPEGIAIADAPDYRVRMISRHGLELSGAAADEAFPSPQGFGAVSARVRHGDGTEVTRPDELPLRRAALRGETIADEEWLVVRPDGSSIPVSCNAAPIRDAAGNITGGLLAWRDLSLRKGIEDKLREAAKLESLGVLAGGIAHDFNNLLTGIMGHASILAGDLPQGSSGWYSAQSIVQTAERAALLTQQMLAYSGRGRFVVQPVHLSRWIAEMEPFIRSAIGKNVELHLELAPELLLVEADLAQLQQVAMNLIVNGAEAMEASGGRLTVATRAERIDEAYIRTLRLADALSPGTYVVFEVEDTGCGMDEATLSRIFDPFFSTKFTGRGLGLAAVQGIIRGHKGAIKVYTSPGAGTRFRVLLPVRAGSSAAPEMPPDAGRREPMQTGGTVLVVDDEAIVRSTARAALESLGCRVLLAEDGARAIAVYRENGAAIDLVILDMTMPGLGGEETMRGLREIHEDAAILLSSGFSETEALRRFGHHGLAGFLQKPYTLRTLAEKVRAIVGERR
jgi:two-component system, cell cycle sensor histidine kinase and response regulator CckA